jgi:hypothetical protein
VIAALTKAEFQGMRIERPNPATPSNVVVARRR